MKTKKTYLSIIRLAIQILFFVLLPALYVNAFSGLQQIYLAIIQQNFDFTLLLPQILETAAIIPATVLLGRFFCGWMCAFGTLGDLIYLASQKIFRTKFTINPDTDRTLKKVKYAVLAFLVVAVWTLGIGVFASASPWNVFGMIATVGAAPDFSYILSSLLPGLVIFLAIVTCSAFVERFFCRYLCPLGAVLAMISKLRILKIKKPGGNCGNCTACTKQCAMGISMKAEDLVSSGECINCFQCISACPRKNISVAVSEQDLRPVVAGVVAVTVIAGTYYAGSLASNSDYISYGASAVINEQAADPSADTASNDAPAAQAANVYADGTYEGTGTGFRGGQTTVSVTIQNDTITDVQVVSYEDDAPFFDRAVNSVISQILSSQSTQVNAVSGATYSSNGIMAAVADALNAAGNA